MRPLIWPTVFGLLSIVSGVNVLAAGEWVVAARTLQAAIDVAATGGSTPLISVVLLQHLMALAATALGVIGGALLVKRRPVGCTLLRIYAIVRLAHLLIQPLIVLLDSGRGYDLHRALIPLGAHSPYPVVLLVWMCLRKTRRQADAMRDPIQRAAMRPATGSVWPVVIGLLMLMMTATSVLRIGLSLLAWPMVLEAVGPGPGYRAFNDPIRTLILLARLIVPWTASITAGLGLLGRRRWAGKLAPIWAVLAILSVLVVILQTVRLVQSISPRDPGFDIYRFVLYGLMSTVPGLVLPVFVLIWMLLPKVRAQMAAWTRRGRSRP